MSVKSAKKKTVISAAVTAALISGALLLSPKKQPRCFTILDANGYAANSAIFEHDWTVEMIAKHQKVRVDQVVETPEGSQCGRQYDFQSKKFNEMKANALTTLSAKLPRATGGTHTTETEWAK